MSDLEDYVSAKLKELETTLGTKVKGKAGKAWLRGYMQGVEDGRKLGKAEQETEEA